MRNHTVSIPLKNSFILSIELNQVENHEWDKAFGNIYSIIIELRKEKFFKDNTNLGSLSPQKPKFCEVGGTDLYRSANRNCLLLQWNFANGLG